MGVHLDRGASDHVNLGVLLGVHLDRGAKDYLDLVVKDHLDVVVVDSMMTAGVVVDGGAIGKRDILDFSI